MFVLFLLFSFVAVANTDPVPQYSNLLELTDNEDDVNNNIIITLTTTITSTTTSYNIIEQAQIIKTKIDNYKTAAGILVPSVCGAVIFTVSILGYYIKKCYLNNCFCKSSWFKIKSTSKYVHRREVARQRERALDEIVLQLQQSSPTIYSIA